MPVGIHIILGELKEGGEVFLVTKEAISVAGEVIGLERGLQEEEK